MKKQESIDIIIDSETKKIAESVFEQFGITQSEAIELFYRQVATTKDIPFIDRNLNNTTIEAIEELNHKENLSSYTSFADICDDLEV
ncbi:type II toxin-antitoxin system RelB/DinJ family antitoxin [Crocosphaera sp.]|uniref:type II toxin-antitoxin system RelB/DinJ family antitoxin n=1 Tax=Crocosphaera sp. TaxID=2729996 RepID=UPI00261CBC68|nr:type II toxin-antitoxin system RelB/DinJ family antitoxin [Crocosphaera sp.]MDJ0580709.1 type II toxin-antitoxin system RelB/DinJ family antitoxin [Crocosphaera sp.]